MWHGFASAVSCWVLWFRLVLRAHFVSLLPWAQIKRMLPLIAATYVGVALPSIGSTIMVQYPSIHLASVQGTAAVAPYGIAMLLASVLALVFLQLGRVLNPDLVRTVRPTATRGVVARFTAKYLAVTISSSAIYVGLPISLLLWFLISSFHQPTAQVSWCFEYCLPG